MRSRAIPPALAAALALLLVACPAPGAPPTGSLVVVVDGLPTELAADVTVFGPDGSSRAATATTIFNGLAPGTYVVSAATIRSAVVARAFDPSVEPASVAVVAGEAATSTVTYALLPGSLAVVVDGLPSGVDGAVRVEGPDGFSRTVTGTTTLTGLEPGAYALSAAAVRTGDPIVSEVYDVIGAPPATVEVSSGATADAGAAYGPRPGSGRLWRARAGGGLLDGYASAQLAAGEPPTAEVSLSEAGAPTGEFVAFDGSGNAWVVPFATDTIRRFDAARLATSGAVVADAAITVNGGPYSGLAFDAGGNLWLVDTGSEAVVKVTPAQLAAGGTVDPGVAVGNDGASLPDPCGLAFDADGNLWVSNVGGGIVRFTPAQLAASGTPAPDVQLGSAGGAPLSACGIAFDGDGRLWIGDFGTDTVLGYTPAQLAASGAPTPAVTLGSDGASLDGPLALAFDDGGALWVNSSGSESLERFAPAQLAASGAPTPDVAIATGASSGVGGLAFSPPPAELPIHAP